MRAYFLVYLGLTLKVLMMKFFEVTEHYGNALTINPNHVVKFTADPNGGCIITMITGDDINVNDEYHSLRAELNKFV
jgi:hypothetical protein